MNRIKLLLKYFIGNSFNNASSNIKSRNLAIVMYILIIIGISTPIANMIDSMYPNFASIGQEGYLLSIIFLIGSLTLLVLGVYDILDSFFFSQDIEPLMPLPFKSGEIMIGKFITCLVDMYIYLSITIIPLISFGLNAKIGFSYFLMIIPVYLFAPIIIVIFCILITMILMSFINVSKYQNTFKIIFGTLGIVLILGVYSLNSTGLNSVASSWALDIQSSLNTNLSFEKQTKIGQRVSLIVGIFSIIVSMILANGEIKSAYEWFNGFMGLVLGILVGTFILGAFTKTANKFGASLAFVAASGVMIYIKYFVDPAKISFWSYSIISIVVSLIVGLIASVIYNKIKGKETIVPKNTTIYNQN